MRKLFFAAAIVLLAGCGDDGGNGGGPVGPTGPVRVRSVALSETTLALEVGQTASLTATVLPDTADNKAVTWASSDESVATAISSGPGSVAGDPGSATVTVTALAPGNTTITVTTVDGVGSVYGPKTATCTVMVIPPSDPEDVLTMIPDPAFRAYCEEQMTAWDADGNGKLSPEEAAAVTLINVSGASETRPGNIVSVEGIEHFTGLTWLECAWNRITGLDLSNNRALIDLDCKGNLLSTLDVSGSTALEYLSCSSNDLSELDVSNNTELDTLHCVGNELTSLDLSNNTALRILTCGENRITSLDISRNTKLQMLSHFLMNINVSSFPITAWFDNDSIPNNFSPGITIGTEEWWTYVPIVYTKAR